MALNVSLPYLNRVLNGQMTSRRLLEAVMKLKPQGPKNQPVYSTAA